MIIPRECLRQITFSVTNVPPHVSFEASVLDVKMTGVESNTRTLMLARRVRGERAGNRYKTERATGSLKRKGDDMTDLQNFFAYK